MGHSIDNCGALRGRVQALIRNGWLKIEGNESLPNVTSNPLPNHGAGNGMNMIELGDESKESPLEPSINVIQLDSMSEALISPIAKGQELENWEAEDIPVLNLDGGQVLDLETAVKDGILRGSGGGLISTVGVEKLDLKMMFEVDGSTVRIYMSDLIVPNARPSDALQSRLMRDPTSSNGSLLANILALRQSKSSGIIRCTIPNVVTLLMKVSESCTQLALSILWAVCKLAPEECAALAVEAGLATKLLLLMQSSCTSAEAVIS
ncbi:uncharacterized protein LOC131177891 [Hevea brasiliensis]|uniref:uncharacterized protein LOC131177891 n=1 Tax=Hevea brasiliensis TaxID=3981 RepID=UPI0025CE8BEB|nr:uncharacterized protein LOC131177891 [Hevea brasiliensis]